MEPKHQIRRCRGPRARNLLLLAAFGLAGGAARPAASSPPDDRGVLVLSVAGRPLGTEKFEIRTSGDRIEARAEIALRVEQNGRSVEVRTYPDLVLNSRFEPQSYSWSQKGAQASELKVDFRTSPAECHYRTVSGQEDRRDFNLSKDVLVLDDNVFHQYQLVVSRWKSSAPGPQTFQAFVPQEAAPGAMTVEEIANDSSAAGAEKLRHLRVSTELSKIDLWVDGRGRLQRVSNPETQFEAVRKK